MNYRIAVSIIFLSVSLSIAKEKYIDFRLIDGKVVFSKSLANDTTTWSQSDEDRETNNVNDYNLKVTSAPKKNTAVNQFSPRANDVNISTCILTFSNFTEFEKCFNDDKKTLIKKAIEIKRKRDDYVDFPNSEEYKDYNDRYNWLKQYIDSLP